jgi:uncharacterized spore protein YtfJ
VEEILSQARDLVTVKRVFGEPYEKDGVTFIPAARVMGGGGGGSGEDNEGRGKGSGGGFGVGAQPAGAYVIKDGQVRWMPAIDINRVILGGQIVAIVAILTIRALIKSRAPRPQE